MGYHDYKKEAVTELSERLMDKGFRVFIAESGGYGFYTNKAGSRLVSFQYDLYGGMSFSGNYTTSEPRQCGQGWQISDTDNGNYESMLNTNAPRWAVRDAKVTYKTVEDHLNLYGKSSKYKEQTK